jgi:hypothetical protein
LAVALLGRRRTETPENAFAQEMIALIRAELGREAKAVPGFALEVPRPEGGPIRMQLHNVFLEAKGSEPKARRSRLRTAVLNLQKTARPRTWDEARGRVLPVLRPASWVAATAQADLPTRAWGPFIKLLCAIDSEHGMSFVNRGDQTAWGVERDVLEQTAITNLTSKGMPAKCASNVLFATGPDGYASSWLAVPDVLHQAAQRIGGDVIALAPSRDELTLLSLSGPAAVIRAIEMTEEAFTSAPRHLSPVPYAVREDGVTPWDPPQDHPARHVVDRAKGVLALFEYDQQRAVLDQLFAQAGEDVFVANYSLRQRADRSVWSYTLWVKQVTDGLIPEADFVVLGDNENSAEKLCVRWGDAVGLSGGALREETGYDPPLWRYHAWP